MLNETFGDLLFYPKSDSLEEFPSPEDLMLRILISTKPPKKFLEPKTLSDKDKDQLQKETEEEPWGEEVSDLKADSSAEYKVPQVEFIICCCFTTS